MEVRGFSAFFFQLVYLTARLRRERIVSILPLSATVEISGVLILFDRRPVAQVSEYVSIQFRGACTSLVYTATAWGAHLPFCSSFTDMSYYSHTDTTGASSQE